MKQPTRKNFLSWIYSTGMMTGFVLLLGTFGHWEKVGLTKLQLFEQITFSLLICCGFGYALIDLLRRQK